MVPLTGKTTSPGQLRRTRALTTALVTLFLVYTFLPIFYLIVSATKSNAELFSAFGLWFGSDFNFVSNLRELLAHDGGIYVNWLWNTAYYSVASALGASLVSAMAGYAFAKFRFSGRTLLFAAVLGAVMIPQTALAIPIYLMLSKVALVDTPLAVILPSMIFPLGIYLMRVYAEQALPDDLLDAARVDGAGELRIFWSVAFRILVPGFVTVLLLSFVHTWNNYFLPLVVLNTTELYPLTVGLATWNQQATAGGGAQVLYPLILTGALIAIVPVIILFLFLQRYWQGGLAVGSTK